MITISCKLVASPLASKIYQQLSLECKSVIKTFDVLL